MENLPFLALKELFGLLPSLTEMIQYSHVCRNWRAAYETIIKPDCLCLHFEKSSESIPLSHRLFYTNDRVSKFCFLKIGRPFDELRFFDSPSASIHFQNIKKLIIFPTPFDHRQPVRKILTFIFQSKLNPFRALEYVEIHKQIIKLEYCELDLPNLRVLYFEWCAFVGEKAQIVLNTPSLEVMRLTADGLYYPEDAVRITNFKFLFPAALRHLEMGLYKANFGFETKFENLEVLIFANLDYTVDKRLDRDREKGTATTLLFKEDFLNALPGLKYLFYPWFLRPIDSQKLNAGKRKYNLNDLKIFDKKIAPQFGEIDIDWRIYLKHRKQLRYWPDEFEIVFDKLIDYQISLDHFKEGYFRISKLIVRHVADQQPLVDLLRIGQNFSLELGEESNRCNVGQSFFNEIADSRCSSRKWTLDETTFDRMNDFSVLSRLIINRFVITFQQVHRGPFIALLRNPHCFLFRFHNYQGFSSGYLNLDPKYCHNIQRAGDEFICQSCGWISSNDPDRLEDPVEVTVRHIGNIHTSNMTEQERKPLYVTYVS